MVDGWVFTLSKKLSTTAISFKESQDYNPRVAVGILKIIHN